MKSITINSYIARNDEHLRALCNGVTLLLAQEGVALEGGADSHDYGYDGGLFESRGLTRHQSSMVTRFLRRNAHWWPE